MIGYLSATSGLLVIYIL